jgi:hypothetical protein
MTWLDDLQLNTVILERKDGPSLRGIKQAVYDDGVLLRDVAADYEDTGWVTLEGEHFTPRGNIIGIQIMRGDQPAGGDS